MKKIRNKKQVAMKKRNKKRARWYEKKEERTRAEQNGRRKKMQVGRIKV